MLTNDNVKLARIGTTDDTALKSSITSWQSIYTNYLASSGNKLKKRSKLIILFFYQFKFNFIFNIWIATVTPFTCEQLTNGPPYAFSVSYLTSAYIPQAVFDSCVTVLGSSTNTYSTDQIIALATLAKVIIIFRKYIFI